MTAFFTADTHFGDRHILRQRGAAFADIAAHDAALIAAWNEAVAPSDDVWHLGDFASDTSREHCGDVFARLNGRKRLIRGNHDTNRVLDLPWCEPPIESLRLVVRDDHGAEWRFFLAHYAHRAWPGLWRGTRHLYGHTHGRLGDIGTELVGPARTAFAAGRRYAGVSPVAGRPFLNRDDALRDGRG